MDLLLNLLAFVFALSLIILVHEGGHFFFAKKANILCYEFSLGMGPVIWKIKKGETNYGIRAIPIGGFVAMAGEEVTKDQIKIGDKIGLVLVEGKVSEIILNEELTSDIKGEVFGFDLYGKDTNKLYIDLILDDRREIYEVLENAKYVISEKQELQIAPYNRCFESKSILERFLSIVFGPIMNFVLAFFLFIIVALITGFPVKDQTEIGVVTGVSLEILLPGDQITKINGTSVSVWDDVSTLIDNQIGVTEIIEIEVDRNEETHVFQIFPMIYIGNLGVYGRNQDGITNGAPIKLYTTAAEEAGLADDDLITGINGTPITSWHDLINVCLTLDDQEDAVVTLMRGTESKTVTVNILDDEALDGVGIAKVDFMVGIGPKMQFNFFESIKAGFVNIGSVVSDIFKTFGLLFGGSDDISIKNLAGPVGIFSMVGNSLDAGFVNFLYFIGMLSVNIGLLNLLPIPALDGGRLVFLTYEAISRKPLPRKIENIINTVMLFLIFGLFIYITFNDVLRLF